MMYLYFGFIFIIGTAIGSFLNVLIDRLANDQSIMGRSHCDYCKKTLKSSDLIPVVSFIVMRGTSRCCRKKLSFQYPLIEILTGLIFAIIFFNTQRLGILPDKNWLYIISVFGIASTLIVIFVADLKYQIIPDSMQIALLFFVVLLSVSGQFSFNLLINNIVAGFVIMAPILLLYLVTKGRGMGFGDVKLSFTIGFWLGIKGGAVSLYIGFIIGAIFSILLILLKKKKLKSKIAFGPFLVIGMITVAILKDPIFSWMMSVYGI